jgi:hypothetical protein
MDDIIAGTKTTVRLSAEEVAQRREHVRAADANNRIEGIFRDPESDVIFDAYVRGEIEATEIITRLKALPDVR